MKINLFCFIGIFFILFPLDYSKAECITKPEINETLIECETEENATYNITSFSESKATTSIIPLYTNNNIYVTVKTTGININNDNHVLNIGNPNNIGNPRIDVEITTFNNRVGNETINIYGFDINNNPSSLYITTLKNDYGSLVINGELRNKIELQNVSIKDDFYINNIDAKIENLSVNDITLYDSILNLNNNGTVSINNINANENSDLIISYNGKINFINSMGDIYFSGANTTINVGVISSSGNIILENNMEVIIDEILKNNKIIFLGEGSLTFNNLNIEEIVIESEKINEKSYIKVLNDITTENLYVKNAQLDLLANSISIQDFVFLENASLDIKGNISSNKVEVYNSFIKSDNNLEALDLLLNNSSINFNNIKIDRSLLIERSLLNSDKVSFISFKENPSLTIGITGDNIFTNSQGNLKNGIYSYGDVSISSNVELNLTLMGSDGIKQGESIISEIIYSKNGKINYTPNTIFFNGEKSSILDINYYILQENGESFLVEITRSLSYCDALNKSGISCSNSNNPKYKEDTFISDTAIILDDIIKQGIPITDNLSKLIGALDKSTLETIEGNFASLKPLSNDVLLFENYKNTSFIKNLYMNNNDKDNNLSAIILNGTIEDNVFYESSDTSLFGIYYGVSFDNNLGLGLSLTKSEIDGYLYKVEDMGLLLLSSYNLDLNYINLNFIGSYNINKYDKSKVNFNNSLSESNSILNNFSLRTSISNSYFIDDIKISPIFYYDVSYLTLNGYKERGEGYLYEVLSTNSVINEFNIGFDLSSNILNNKTLLSVGFNTFYLLYDSNGLQAKPYEVVSDYIKFNNDLYSGLGFSFNVGVDYKLKENMNMNFSYSLASYNGNSVVNGIVLTIGL